MDRTQDPSAARENPPAAPPRPDAADGDAGVTERFRAWMGVLIALVSIVGALIAWRASLASITAGDLEQQASQILIYRQQQESDVESRIAQDFRLFGSYQEHILTWRILREQADQVAEEDAELAETLREDAREQFSLARTLRPFFLVPPDYGDAQGLVAYDPTFVIEQIQRSDIELAGLRPSQVLAQSETAHRRMLDLVGLGVLLAASLLFLTAAQFARRSARRVFAVSGIAISLVVVVLFVSTELAG